MGSKSKSRSSNTSQSTSNTMAGLAKNKVSNEEVMGLQGNLQANLLNTMLPGFGAMVKDGMQSFGSNPMANVMGAMFGQPMQMQTPDFLSAFIDKYKPVEEEPTQQQQFGAMPPSAPQFNVNDYMRNQFMGPQR